MRRQAEDCLTAVQNDGWFATRITTTASPWPDWLSWGIGIANVTKGTFGDIGGTCPVCPANTQGDVQGHPPYRGVLCPLCSTRCLWQLRKIPVQLNPKMGLRVGGSNYYRMCAETDLMPPPCLLPMP